MTGFQTNRRALLAAGAGLVAMGGGAAAGAVVPGEAAAPAFTALPLPFDPASVGWLSEKLIVSHHDNNYAGAVRRLSSIRAEVAKLDMASAPGFTLNGLKREELVAWNSMILHELYFAGLGKASPPSPGLGKAIERDFGSIDRWAAEFAALGKALGGGSGWVLLTWSPHDGRLVNQWAADHSMTLAGATPLLALDMYEHAYALDFGAKAAAYVDGFMAGMSWANTNRIYDRVQASMPG